MTEPGQMPPTTGVCMEADGANQGAPVQMGSACEQAATQAVSHREQEGRKVGM